MGREQRRGLLQQPLDARPQFPGAVVGLHQLLHDDTGRVGERGDRRLVGRACLQGGKDGLVGLGDQGQGDLVRPAQVIEAIRQLREAGAVTAQPRATHAKT
ncbi:hypothetical protein [Streptomyces sp. NPDC050121]|uniref:hypothetical protein n=1 Tax=Streptomyces sp. NPDC050121 TaxID=3365601 RepID=UPI0037A1E799